MATYAIGDIQGCFDSFRRLLDVINFDPGSDRLLLVGDLVNRGPASVEVLRFARAHDACVVAVLGNHEIHLLGRFMRTARPGRQDTLDPVLAAPDADALIDWVRTRPLLFREGAYLMVHAGIPPGWSLRDAERRAREVEKALRGPHWREVASALRGSRGPWKKSWGARPRLCETTKVLTRVRMVDRDGKPDYAFKSEPETAPGWLTPWYEARVWREDEPLVIFGHWAALGYRRGPHWVALDSGCVWGQSLTALRLEDDEVFVQAAVERVESEPGDE